MSLWDEYQAENATAQTASRQVGRLGATETDEFRARAAKREAARLEEEVRKQADLNVAIPATVQETLEKRILAMVRSEIKNMLPPSLRGLAENFTDGPAPLVATLDATGMSFWGKIISSEASSDYGFKVTATEEYDEEGATYDPPQFTVRVLSGPAQVLGGEEKIFDDETFENVVDGEIIYIRYKIWDSGRVAICAWDADIQHSATPPVGETDAPKSLVFALAKIGKDYANNVNQYRLGGIQAVATINASPDSNVIPTD